MHQQSTTRLCFIGTILIGLGFLLAGVFLIPAMPHFQLDVVLTADELKDDVLRESTLELLKKALGNQWIVWTLGGLAQIAIGIRGYRLFQTQMPQTSQASHWKFEHVSGSVAEQSTICQVDI